MTKVQIPIDSMAFKGYGVARLHGKVVFVPYTVTGDKAWVEVTEEKKKYSKGRLIQLIEPSSRRVNPPCPYFGSCGGCQWQHINYMAQPELKKEILRDLLKRLGRLQEIPFIGVFPSSKPYDYRIRIQLKVRGKAMGYYREGSHQIVDIDHCPISHPLANRILRRLRGEFAVFQLMKEIEINVSPEEGRNDFISSSFAQSANRAFRKETSSERTDPPGYRCRGKGEVSSLRRSSGV